jgi:CRP-like cAMP-binding protein
VQAFASLVRKLEQVHALTPTEREVLQKLPVTLREFPPGDHVVHEGDKPHLVCMVVSGVTYRYTIVGSGKRQIMAFYVPGDIPDLSSLFIQEMDHSIATLVASTIAAIPHEAMRRLFEQHPRLGERFWRETLIDGAIMRKWLASVGSRTAEACLAHIICEFVTRMRAVGLSDGVTCDFPMTQTDLGDAAGISTVHVNRTLRDLRDRGLVTWGARSVTINDWAGLMAVGDFDPSYLQLPR